MSEHPSIKSSPLSRRHFIGQLALGLGWFSFAWGLLRWLSLPTYQPQNQHVVLGAATELEQQTYHYFPLYQLWLRYQSGTFFALKAVCPHLGCLPKRAVTGFACPCHGSLFNESGQQVQGPAMRALERFPIFLNDRQEVVVRLEQTYYFEQGEWSLPDASLSWPVT